MTNDTTRIGFDIKSSGDTTIIDSTTRFTIVVPYEQLQDIANNARGVHENSQRYLASQDRDKLNTPEDLDEFDRRVAASIERLSLQAGRGNDALRVRVTDPPAERGPSDEFGSCICKGRGGHTNPACPWYGTDLRTGETS